MDTTNADDCIEREIARLGPWERLCEVRPGVYTIPRERWAAHRSAISHQHFLVRVLREALRSFVPDPANASVLDFGCNCGWLSLSLRGYGFRSVLGVDASGRRIRQAEFLLAQHGLDGVRFERGSCSLLGGEPFDLICCFGVLNHTARPLEMLEALHGCSRGLLFVDCNCFLDERPVCADGKNRDVSPLSCHVDRDEGLVFNYSRRAVIDLLRASGFRNLYALEPPGAVPAHGYYTNRLFVVAEKGPRGAWQFERTLQGLYDRADPAAYVTDPTFALDAAAAPGEPRPQRCETVLDVPAERMAEVYEAFAAAHPGRRVWGASGMYRAYRACLRGLEVEAVVDNDPERVGALLEGVPVISPEEAARREPRPILVFSHAKREICDQIRYRLPAVDEIP